MKRTIRLFLIAAVLSGAAWYGYKRALSRMPYEPVDEIDATQMAIADYLSTVTTDDQRMALHRRMMRDLPGELKKDQELVAEYEAQVALAKAAGVSDYDLEVGYGPDGKLKWRCRKDAKKR